MSNPKPTDSKFTEEDLKKQVRLLRSQGPDIFFVFENVYRYEEKGIGEGGEMRKVEGGKIKVRNRHRLNQLQEIKVIRQLVGPEGYDGYLVHFNNPGQAIDVLGLLGTKTIEYRIQRKGEAPKVSGVCTGGGTINKMRGHPRSKVTILVPDIFEIHHVYLPYRIEMRILLREGLWHEIMELAILAINGRVFDDPAGLATTDISTKAVAGSIIDQAVNNALKQKSKHDFYPWEGDIEEDGDAWAHQGKTWEEEAERLEGVASMLENQGTYIRANYVWAEAADAWEKAAQAWEASTYPEAAERAKTARKNMESALRKAGHWEVVGSPGKKVTIKYENWFGDFKAVITDYVYRWVESKTGPSSRNGRIIFGEKVAPGFYHIEEINTGEKAEFKILPKKSLVLEAKFVRDSFGSLYLSIEYKNWPTGKRIGIRIIGPSGSELHSKETERTDGKLEWGKNHDFKLGEYTITAFVNQQYGDPFLKELLQKGQLVAPKKIKAPAWDVSSAGRYIVITYKNWIDRFRGEILDTSGKKMETFDKSSGDGKIEWGDNSKVEAGVYFVKVKLGSHKYEVKKAIILK